MPDVADDYQPNQDPEVILLRLAHRRAELAHWQAVARRWWASLVTLLSLYSTTIILGLASDLQIVAGILTLISGLALGFWHEGTSKGNTLRRNIEEGERDHLAALRRAEHQAEAEADEREAQALAALDEQEAQQRLLNEPIRLSGLSEVLVTYLTELRQR